MSLIVAQQLFYAWPKAKHGLLLEHFSLEPGERVLLQGVSGSGKSTLLALFSGILKPCSGSLQLAGYELTKSWAAKRDALRAELVGMVHQQLHLLPYLTVADNILLGAYTSAKRLASSRANNQQQLRSLLAALDMAEDLLHRPVHQLSIGQQQRVAIARALIGNPKVILADEPTSSLDPENRDRFMQLLLSNAKQLGAAVILVSHDPQMRQFAFDRQLQLAELVRMVPCSGQN